MIAASPEITRSGIVFAAAHVFPSFDDHHETEPSRLFLPTENPEGPLQKGGSKWDYSKCNKSSSPFVKGGSRPARHRSRSGEAGGGILLRGRLPEDHRSILTLQAKLKYTTSTAGGF